MKLLRYFYIILAFSLISCNTDKAKKPGSVQDNSQIKENQQYKDRVEGLKKKSPEQNIPALRAQALSILNYRLQKDSSSYAIIEADTWEYKFVFNGAMSKPGEYDGAWIDFKKDATYTYGKKNQVLGYGKYNYSFERAELLMVDNEESEKPQEWSVKNAGDAMVLVGTSTYKDNSTQMKLERVKDAIQTRQ